MGVAGCGKSTLGQALADAMKLTFIEGDQFHPTENLQKMSQGIALDDADRQGWLDRLGVELLRYPAGAVLSCSALKRAYRARLRKAVPGLYFVHLSITQETANARVTARSGGHLFPSSLVASQFATLEDPRGEDRVLQLDGTLALSTLSAKALAWIDAQSQTALIALDWGTSSLRAYRLDATGRALEVRALPRGVMKLSELEIPAKFGADSKAAFEFAFEEACGDWKRATPQVPVIAAGMVGSRQGWQEAPYLSIPVAVDQIGSKLSTVPTRSGQIVHIVPGLIENSALPNVMRGEETQVIGALSTLDFSAVPSYAEQQNKQDEILIGLPGSHSKWVQVTRQHQPAQDHIEHFHTFMTGEVYAALCEHTILGCGMQIGHANGDVIGDDHAAFDRGVLVAQTPAGRAGVLSTIFSTRTLGLTGILDGASQREYLSGLLIGHEVAALQDMLEAQRYQPACVVLVGDAALCDRYARALRAYGMDQIEVAGQATERGLWQLAVGAGLVRGVQP